MPFKDPISNNSCQSVQDPLPEWFKQYMKKFKKELLQELRSNISEMVHEEFIKEKKLSGTKFCKPDKNEFSSPTKLKKKKKTFDKDTDLFEKREMKLLKKIEKLHSYKFDRLMHPVLYVEKLESKTNPPLEEKRTLLERRHQSKPKDAQKTQEPEKKYVKSGKFALLSESYVFLILQPGAEFSFTVNIINNGTVPWVSPRMECLSAPEIYVKEHLIDLPRLEPGQSVNVTLRGKVTQRLGQYYFAYKLFDGLEEFGPLFSCAAIVSDSKKKIIKNSSEQLKPDNKVTPAGNLVGTLIDFENVMITSSQKKIKENIIEIERRLQDIDLLRLCTSSDESREERLNDNSGKFQVRGCGSLQGKERKHWQERLEEEVSFGADPLQQKEETEKSRQKDGDIKNENFQTKKNGAESDSDSELSVIFTSEEDENFIFVSLLPESSNSKTINNATKPSKVDCNKKSNEVDLKPKKGVVEERSVEVELKEVGSKEINATEDSTPSRLLTKDEGFSEKAKPLFQSIPIPTIAAPPNVISNKSFRDNVPEYVPPRMFGEMGFPLASIKVKVGSNGGPIIAHSPGKITISRNTKAGEKRNPDQSAPRYVLYETQELQEIKMNDTARKGHCINVVPISDRFGKPIYAVRKDGYCLPLKDLIQNKVTVSKVEMGEPKEKTQNEVKEEADVNYETNGSIITIIPNGMMNGASIVASMAFNTAKSAIKNLQSAFKPEVENKPRDFEKQKPHEESLNNFPYNLYSMGEEERHYVETLANQERYIDAMLTLHEMGFVNNDLNFRLLKKYESEVTFVVDEIVDMPVMETPQDAE